MATESSSSLNTPPSVSSMDVDGLEEDVLEGLAVVGFSFKFPQGATTPAAFWEMLEAARCVSTEFPPERLNIDAFYNENGERQGTLGLRGGHFLQENLGAFDAPFFAITPAEAAALDPQQRMLLETAYHALENAGMPMDQVLGSNTSVHTGCFTADYMSLASKDPEDMSKYSAIGVAATMLANRVSWFFDLKGNSVQMDSACSSSLVALDAACQGLWNGSSSMALVGGCNLIYALDTTMGLSNMSFLSPDSRCWSFDHRGNGYGRGEGIGMVVIKRISDALSDGDTIRAVIRSTGSNQDGRTPGITQPNMESQEALIRATYEKAHLDPGITRFFEAHGTGTPVGDPIEARAIGSVFREYRSAEDPLYIGAVKSNVGHLEGCSGLAGLIKAIMALEKGVIPPNSNFEKVNPKIDAEYLNLAFPSSSMPWPVNGVRRASVNSFGFAGTNSHVILDDASSYIRLRGLEGRHCTEPLTPCAELSSTSSSHPDSFGSVSSSLPREPKILLLSANDDKALGRMNDAHIRFFEESSRLGQITGSYLNNLAYTLDTRRSSLSWKSYAVIQDICRITISKPVLSDVGCKLGFVFTGQGAQWAGMGAELLSFPVFESSLLRAGHYLAEIGCDWNLLGEMLKDKNSSRINEPELSQSISTAVQVALVDLLRSFGVIPAAVIGHSSGEIAAAYSAGAISSESAWKIAYYRGHLASKLASEARGGMMAVGLSKNEVEPYLSRLDTSADALPVTVSCENSPTSVTISGDPSLLEFLKLVLDADKVFSRKLQVDVAYHSTQMNQIAEEYLTMLKDIQAGGTELRDTIMVSSVTGESVSLERLRQGEYWMENMLKPVRFSVALSKISQSSNRARRRKLDLSHLNSVQVNSLLEIGPHSALQGPIRDTLQSLGHTEVITYQSALVRNRSALETLLTACGRIYCQGCHVDIRAINRPRALDKSKCQVLTDLPEYPFDHSNIHWYESRMSKGLRFRKFPLNPLLGVQASDWNWLEGKWKNKLKVSDMPWIEDHKIDGSILYPGAGMVVMAIEAARQTARSSSQVLGYEVEDVTFNAPINFSSKPNGIETQFFLRPIGDKSGKESQWSEFRLFIWETNEWMETCQGNIRVVYQSGPNSDVGHHDLEKREELSSVVQAHADATRRCDKTCDGNTLYKGLAQSGYRYGPTFELVQSLDFNTQGEAIGHVRLGHDNLDISSSTSCTIHPTTFDGILQLSVAALTHGGSTVAPTSIPTRVGKMWLSDTLLRTAADQTVQACATIRDMGYIGTVSSISVLDSTGTDLCMTVENFETTTIAKAQASSEDLMASNQKVYGLKWKPDINLLESGKLMAYCSSGLNTEPDPIEFFQDLKAFRSLVISDVVEDVEIMKAQDRPAHLARYVDWLRMQDSKLSKPVLAGQSNLDAISQRIQSYDQQGELAVRTGSNLKCVLRGEADPLQLFFQDSLMKGYYHHVNKRSTGFQKLARYLDALAHKNPQMNILEVGAGTGSATEMLLNTLAAEDTGHPRYSRYDFTDISSSFFAEARETFRSHEDMSFTTLNIENEPLAQGFEAGSYDLIVAAHVLHATVSLKRTMENIRKLLKPGGKLILVEITRPGILGVGFTFGLLSGWWLGCEEYRKYSPCIPAGKWNEILGENGFSGTDTLFRDYESDECHEWSILVSTATDLSLPSPPPCLVIIDEDSYNQRHLADTLCQDLQPIRDDYAILSLQEASMSPLISTALCVFLCEMERPVMRTLNELHFKALQSIFGKAHKILWVTNGGGSAPITADSGIITGMSRALRTESTNLVIATLALSPSEGGGSSPLGQITKVARSILPVSENQSYEAEYVERQGMLHISRIVEDHDLASKTRSDRSGRKMHTLPLQNAPPIKLAIETPGLLETLQFVDDDRYAKPLGEREIEVEVRAVGVNFRDTLIALGRLKTDHGDSPLGWECSGVISRVGKGCLLNPGTRVAVVYGGSFRSYTRCPEDCATPISDQLSFVDAAAVPVTHTTIYHGLCHIARMERGETILIHAGAGGTGQAAIQIAKEIGAQIYVTVGSEDKKKLIMDLYQIPEEHILYSRDTSFAKGINRLTHGRGVDVVLNSLDGERLLASWNCIAPFGRFIEIGKKDIQSRTKLSMHPFNENVTFSAVDLAAMSLQRPDLLQKSLAAVMKLIDAGKIGTAKPITTYRLSEIETAFRLMQSGKNSGKLVVEFDRNEEIPMFLVPKHTSCFKEDATYLISGGLGGLGRSISRWMVGQGAKHLVLLSRSGADRPKAQEFVDELRQQGAVVEAPACDITDPTALEGVLEFARKNMPPIRGCIQGSMVLKDSVFQTMCFEDWKTSLDAKVGGTWNLHTLLPRDLDFFVFLSSVSGVIGMGGQTNYAAGNAFQDEMVNYRVSRGLKAVSLDLGPMLSEGFLAENEDLMDRFMRNGNLSGVSQEDLFALLGHYCDPNLATEALENYQVVNGLIPPTVLNARGVELPSWIERPMFNHLHLVNGASESSQSTSGAEALDFTTAFTAADSIAEAGIIVADELAKRLSKILSIDAQDFDLSKPIHTYGLDSLVAVEIRNWFQRVVLSEIGTFEILGGITFLELGSLAARRSLSKQLRWTAVEET